MENFEDLLSEYLDEEIINEKIKQDNIESNKEQETQNRKSDITSLDEYAITIPEFVRNYLREETETSVDDLTHKQFKELTKDNPLVVGIFNGDVDIDEVLKQDYVIVKDCFGHLGTYLNPERLRDFTRLDIVEKQYEKVKEMRRLWCKHVFEYYNKYCMAYQELMYLSNKCEVYEEILYKLRKTGKVKQLKNYVDKYGTDSIGIE